jgi:hypothetical protein
MPLTFTPIYSNTLTGANQNPLDPTNLSNASYANLQILSGTAQATLLNQYNVGLYHGTPALGNDQYVSINLVGLANTGELDLLIRSDSTFAVDYYDFGIIDGGDGTTEIFLTNASGFLFDRVEGVLPPNETWFVGCVGTTFYILRNGNLYFKGTDSSFATGQAGFSLFPTVALTDALATNLVIGNLSGSMNFPTVGGGQVGQLINSSLFPLYGINNNI